MSSSVSTSSVTTPTYAKRKLELVPFSSQLEVIDSAILNKTQLNSKQYTNVHRSGYNNNSANNNNNHSHNQNLQNKYALATVAAAAAVQQQQQQQNYMLQLSQQQSQQQAQQQSQQESQQQYKDINPYMFHTQTTGFNKEQGKLSSSSSLLSENNAPLPYDFQNNFITSNGSNNSDPSPTAAPVNQPPPIELQTHSIQNLSQPPMPGFILDPMASDNNKIKSSSPTSLQPQVTTATSKASNSPPLNLFLPTSSSGANAVNSVKSNNSVATNFLDSPSLLPNVNNISNNWASNNNTNTNAINHSSIWGANPSISSSSMIPSNLASLDSKSESKISIQNNFGGSMW